LNSPLSSSRRYSTPPGLATICAIARTALSRVSTPSSGCESVWMNLSHSIR
jgi:hypothetical protein